MAVQDFAIGSWFRISEYRVIQYRCEAISWSISSLHFCHKIMACRAYISWMWEKTWIPLLKVCVREIAIAIIKESYLHNVLTYLCCRQYQNSYNLLICIPSLYNNHQAIQPYSFHTSPVYHARKSIFCVPNYFVFKIYIVSYLIADTLMHHFHYSWYINCTSRTNPALSLILQILSAINPPANVTVVYGLKMITVSSSDLVFIQIFKGYHFSEYHLLTLCMPKYFLMTMGDNRL